MINLFLLFFFLLPWGNFLFKSCDIWHATGQFVQVGILILFCYSFFEKPKYVQILNKPLGSLVCWAGLVTAYGWIKVFSTTQHYPIKIFMPFFNLLCLVLFYKLIVEYLDKDSIEKILKWLKYSVMILLVYCVLQYFKLDEFFAGIKGTGDQLVGTIGNSMHLSGLLALFQPLFFKGGWINILSLFLLWIIILLTGSATGLVAGIAVVLFWLWFKNRKAAIVFLVLSGIFLIALYFIKSTFFTNSQRFMVWGLTWNIVKDHFITGFGLGTFGIANVSPKTVYWRHAHNEYLQVVFELGFIGLVFLGWCIWDYFNKFNSLKTDLSIRLGSIFFGFCLLCGVTFFGHIWQTATFGMFAFASMYCLKNRELKLMKNL